MSNNWQVLAEALIEHFPAEVAIIMNKLILIEQEDFENFNNLEVELLQEFENLYYSKIVQKQREAHDTSALDNSASHINFGG